MVRPEAGLTADMLPIEAAMSVLLTMWTGAIPSGSGRSLIFAKARVANICIKRAENKMLAVQGHANAAV
jgi:hypothetical protein